MELDKFLKTLLDSDILNTNNSISYNNILIDKENSIFDKFNEEVIDYDLDIFEEIDYDLDIFQKIIDVVIDYDLSDLLANISILNLFQENQDKSVLITVLTQVILTIDTNKFNKQNKISYDKFSYIIELLNETTLFNLIDPVENCFIENIMYLGNYIIYPGINSFSGFRLQSLINTIVANKRFIPKEFFNKFDKITNLILEISNKIAINNEDNINNLEINNNINNDKIYIPNKEKLEELKNLEINNNINNDKIYIPNKEKLEELKII